MALLFLFTAVLTLTAITVTASPSPGALSCYIPDRCNVEVVTANFLSILEGAGLTDCQSYAACTSTAADVTVTVTQVLTPTVDIVDATVTPSDSIVSSTVTPSTAVVTALTTLPAITQTVTVTPPLATITITQIPSYAKRDAGQEVARTVLPSGVTCPTAIPDYAPDCRSGDQYASVCSCFGVPRSTQTIAGQTSTVTATTTAKQLTSTELFTADQQTSTVYVTLPQQTLTTTVTLGPETESVSTTLSTQTSTAVVAPPLPTLCDNVGFQWAYYVDNTAVNNLDQDAAYDPAALKTRTPITTGSTPYLGVQYPANSRANIYGGTVQPTNNFALNHRGYIYAPETGTYNFTIQSGVDDLVRVWLANFAYSGWTKSNSVQYGALLTADNIFSFTLQGGSYYPLRLVYKQGPGGAVFNYSVTSPSGIVIVPNNLFAPETPYMVQYSCDGTTAPPYIPFGQET